MIKNHKQGIYLGSSRHVYVNQREFKSQWKSLNSKQKGKKNIDRWKVQTTFKQLKR